MSDERSTVDSALPATSRVSFATFNGERKRPMRSLFVPDVISTSCHRPSTGGAFTIFADQSKTVWNFDFDRGRPIDGGRYEWTPLIDGAGASSLTAVESVIVTRGISRCHRRQERRTALHDLSGATVNQNSISTIIDCQVLETYRQPSCSNRTHLPERPSPKGARRRLAFNDVDFNRLPSGAIVAPQLVGSRLAYDDVRKRVARPAPIQATTVMPFVCDDDHGGVISHHLDHGCQEGEEERRPSTRETADSSIVTGNADSPASLLISAGNLAHRGLTVDALAMSRIEGSQTRFNHHIDDPTWSPAARLQSPNIDASIAEYTVFRSIESGSGSRKRPLSPSTVDAPDKRRPVNTKPKQRRIKDKITDFFPVNKNTSFCRIKTAECVSSSTIHQCQQPSTSNVHDSAEAVTSDPRPSSAFINL